jgi:hypothetical protein
VLRYPAWSGSFPRPISGSRFIQDHPDLIVVFVSKHGNAFINFGDKYPNQTFTGWIPARGMTKGFSWLNCMARGVKWHWYAVMILDTL